MSAAAVIDSLEFAQRGEKMSGTLPVASLPRLNDLVAGQGHEVAYVLSGGHDERQRPMLEVRVTGTLVLQCQRCLGTLEHVVDFENRILLVPAGEIPADADDPDAPDYIEAQSELDVAGLVEDEILLQLPFAPRHESECAGSKPAGSEVQAKPSPFAALAALKNSRKT